MKRVLGDMSNDLAQELAVSKYATPCWERIFTNREK